MIRSVTTFDAEWTDDDMTYALSWARDEASKCPGCAKHTDETMSIEADGAYDAEAVACHACAARDRSVKAYRNNKGDEAGVYWRITERETHG